MSAAGLIPSQIIAALSDGEFTVEQLVAKLGLQEKAIKPHLKRLRADQKIILRRTGSLVRYVSVTGRALPPLPRKPRAAPVVSIPVAEAPAAPRRRGRQTASLGLKVELSLIKKRLSPVEDLYKKLHLLQSLAKTTPKPVSRMLLAIKKDLSRYES